jgi:hypothetical protein
MIGHTEHYENIEEYEGKKIIIFDRLVVPGLVEDKYFKYKNDEEFINSKVSDVELILEEKLQKEITEFLHEKGYGGGKDGKFYFWPKKEKKY